MTRLQVVLASANPDKAAEIAALLSDSVALVPRPAEVPDVVEDGDTLEANARLKAEALCAATGMAAVADDTGFEVEALDGAPGVYAARYAGEAATYADNVAKVLRELERAGATTPPQRRARFRTVALLRWPDGREMLAEGAVHGNVLHEPRGHAGFGYDPIFVPDDGGGASFAEMSAEAKHAISHRGRAFRALAEQLRAEAT